MFNKYAEAKAQVKAQLANAEYFEVDFITTTTCNAFKFVKPGSTRKFKRKPGTNYFIMGSARDVITAASIAHVVANKEAKLAIVC